MFRSKRLLLLACTFAISIGLSWLTLSLDAANDDFPIPRGEACGSGELLPDTALCLHGIVWEELSDGAFLAAEGAVITVRTQDRVVTGTTYIHPGQLAPHYGIDIAPLEPIYLKPITVTVSFKEWGKSEQIFVFPDYATMSQQHD